MFWLIFMLLSCSSVKLDPDNLPSIEILLVSPKVAFPQLRQEVQRLRSQREAAESKLNSLVVTAFTRSRISLIKEVMSIIQPFTSRINKASSFIQGEKSRNVENVAVNILPMHDVGLGVKEEVDAIFDKLARDEDTQIQQSVKEFDEVKSILVEAIKSKLQKYFGAGMSPNHGSSQGDRNSALLQVDSHHDHFEGVKKVLNVRVGSSSLGDGLKDGSSFPSVLSVVKDEVENQIAAENALLNSIMFYTRTLGKDCAQLIRQNFGLMNGRVASSFLDPSAPVANVVKQSLKYLPPGVPRMWRKRAFKHSTIELDIRPPGSDEEIDREQLRALLKSFDIVRRAGLKAFVLARKRLINELVSDIDDAVRQYAVLHGVWRDGTSIPSYTLNELMFSNVTSSL